MIHLEGVLAGAQEVNDFCSARNWHFCFIGGIAVQRWGEPRLTQDVDLTLVTGFGQEESFIKTFLEAFPGRITDAHEFALQRRVLLARTRAGIPIDAALGALPFEERSIQRATAWKWSESKAIKTCSAEDLVIHKCFAGRDRDWSDVESVLTRQRGKVDLPLIRKELPPLLEIKGTLPMLQKFEEILTSIEARFERAP